MYRCRKQFVFCLWHCISYPTYVIIMSGGDNVAKSQSEILIELVSELPAFAGDFLLGRSGERAVSTRIGYARDFKAFLQHQFSNKMPADVTFDDLSEVNPVDIDRYLTLYATTHTEPATARAKVSISAFYKYLVDTLKRVPSNPVVGAGKIRIPKKDFVVFLNLEEQSKLLNTIRYGIGMTDGQLKYHEKLKKRDLAMMFLFLDTGLRVSELAGLQIGDVDLEECSAIVTRKRNKISKIYFSDEAAGYLKDYLFDRRTLSPLTSEMMDPLFTTLKGDAVSVREIEKLVPKYVAAALPGKTGISPHKLRSSFAMEFYGETRDILTLQERMGHESLNTTNIYAKASKENVINTRNWRK